MLALRRHLNSIFGIGDATQELHDAQRAASIAQARAMRLAKGRAKDNGIVIDRDTAGGWWVTCPAFDDGVDPLDGNHFCSTGEEVLEAVDTYVAALAATGGSK